MKLNKSKLELIYGIFFEALILKQLVVIIPKLVLGINLELKVI